MALNNRPNILMIMMDATRADRLSSYGYSSPTSPNIDRIAKEGVLFQNAFSPDVWTLPSMASVFTGLMPHEHGADYETPKVPEKYLTLAELLKEKDYITRGISTSPWIGTATGLNRGFDKFWESYLVIQNKKKSRPVDLVNRFYSKYIHKMYDKGASRSTKEIIKWMKMFKSTDQSNPFFFFLHYLEPHYPYLPPKSYRKAYIPEPNELKKAEKIKYNPLDVFAGKIEISDKEYELLNKLYDGEIAYMDSCIGRIYDAMEKIGLLKDTMIILFADHGENIGHHGLIDHHFCLYDSLIHVPLIIRYPKLFPAGSKVSEPVQTNDIFQTLVQINHLQVNQSPRYSKSLLPETKEWEARPHVLSETTGSFVRAIEGRGPNQDLSVWDHKSICIRDNQYKYIRHSNGSEEFYNLKTDPKETENLLGSVEPLSQNQRQVIEEFKKGFPGLFEVQKESDSDVNLEALTDDPIIKKQLQSLGYLE